MPWQDSIDGCVRIVELKEEVVRDQAQEHAAEREKLGMEGLNHILG